MTDRPRARRAIIVTAVVVVVALIVTGALVLGRLAHQRNAPGRAAYSLDANPTFYADLADVSAQGAAARSLDSLKQQAVAGWLSTDAAQAAAFVRTVTARTSVDHTIPIFVTYAIPDRDLGGQSAGGLDADGYRRYLTSVSQAIGDAPAIVVVEPDALAHVPDITDAATRQTRISLLALALDTFHANSQTAVYLDAGNSRWRPAADMATLLGQVTDKAGSAVPGIALNVANFRPAAETAAYAAAVEKAYGHKLFTLIDTSRSGAIPLTGNFCNPQGERLGTADPTFDPGASVEQAFIKTPGESDGQCGISSARAGVFDPNLLLEQIGAR